MTISADNAQAREAARHSDGTFGEQHLPEPGTLQVGDDTSDAGMRPSDFMRAMAGVSPEREEMVYRLMEVRPQTMFGESGGLAVYVDFEGPDGVDAPHEFVTAADASRAGLLRDVANRYREPFEVIARTVDQPDEAGGGTLTQVGVRLRSGVSILVEHPLTESSTVRDGKGLMAAIGYAEYTRRATERALGIAEDSGMVSLRHVCGVDAFDAWCDGCRAAMSDAGVEPPF